jgi:hypothetical protein
MPAEMLCRDSRQTSRQVPGEDGRSSEINAVEAPASLGPREVHRAGEGTTSTVEGRLQAIRAIDALRVAQKELRSSESVFALDLTAHEGNLLDEYFGEQDILRSPIALVVVVIAFGHSLEDHVSRLSGFFGEDDRAYVGSERPRNVVERETG